jgi:hypothetical protein
MFCCALLKATNHYYRTMYDGVREIFSRYWRAYGGWRALRRSPYLHLALLLLLATYATWSQKEWWDQVISIMPNLLGFTLGGFAMFLGFGDEKFRALLAEPDEDMPGDPSLYVSLCSTFVHFILIQLCAIVCALLAKSWWFEFAWPGFIKQILPVFNWLGGALGYGLFLYAVTSVLAATMHVFRIATWYEKHQTAVAAKEAAATAAAAQKS